MFQHSSLRYFGIFPALAAALFVATARGASPPEEKSAEPVPLEGGSRAGQPGTIEDRPRVTSQYWLGIDCYPLPDALRRHLNLGEAEGLLIEQVVPDSPAADAKLQRHDVLVKVNKTQLYSPEDVIKAVDATNGKKLMAEIIRDGKRLTVELTPAPRPPQMLVQPRHPFADQAQWDEMLKLLEKARPGQSGQPPYRFRFFQPGAVLPPGATALPPIPSDLRVTITKQGDKPAKVQVERGGEKWETTESKLSDLPPDVRRHVERLLGRSMLGHAWAFDQLPGLPGGEKPSADPASPSGGDKRLEEMSRQLEELRKAVDDLRAKK